MIINSNIFTHWDEKLTAYTLKHYQDLRSDYSQKIKPHSLITLLAVFGTTSLFGFISDIRFDNAYGQGLIVVLKTSIGAFCIVAYLAAYYHWRVFFILRKEGINADRNLFFAESAGSFRKIAFYIAFALDSIRSIRSFIHPEDIAQRMRRLKYQLRSEYYHDVGFAILETAVLSILFIEVMRIIFPGTFDWSDKKHWTIVISATLFISAFKVFVLNMSSGHGIF